MGPATPSPPSRCAVASGSHDDEHLRLRDGTAVRLRATDHRASASCDERAGIIAEDAEGRTIGHVVYARVYGRRAEVTLEVDDAFLHRGLTEDLLAGLCDRAARLGITTFLARVRASDVRLLALLVADFAACQTRDGAYVEVEFSTGAQPASGWTTERDARSSPMAVAAAAPTLGP